MGEIKLYVLALFAMKSSAGLPMRMEIGLSGYTLFERSDGEAEQEGLRRAKEKWPVKDGWIGHTVQSTGLDKEELRLALGHMEIAEPDETSHDFVM